MRTKDLVLEYIAEHIDGVGVTVGFCDDWTVERITVRSLLEVRRAGDEFERCSGQQFNGTKSKILPTRSLTACEATSVRVHWEYCPAVSRAKVLGLWYGHDFMAAEVGQEVETKYYDRLRTLKMLPASIASRIALLNVFQRVEESSSPRRVLHF